MKRYLDPSLLMGAVLQTHPEHAACFAVFEPSTADGATCTHALAEAFNAPTGFYRVPNGAAAQLILSLRQSVCVAPLLPMDYETALREAQARGVQGAIIYDALHATVARSLGCPKVITCNPSHFAHLAQDLQILTP